MGVRNHFCTIYKQKFDHSEKAVMGCNCSVFFRLPTKLIFPVGHAINRTSRKNCDHTILRGEGGRGWRKLWNTIISHWSKAVLGLYGGVFSRLPTKTYLHTVENPIIDHFAKNRTKRTWITCSICFAKGKLVVAKTCQLISKKGWQTDRQTKKL